MLLQPDAIKEGATTPELVPKERDRRIIMGIVDRWGASGLPVPMASLIRGGRSRAGSGMIMQSRERLTSLLLPSAFSLFIALLRRCLSVTHRAKEAPLDRRSRRRLRLARHQRDGRGRLRHYGNPKRNYGRSEGRTGERDFQ